METILTKTGEYFASKEWAPAFGKASAAKAVNRLPVTRFFDPQRRPLVSLAGHLDLEACAVALEGYLAGHAAGVADGKQQLGNDLRRLIGASK